MSTATTKRIVCTTQDLPTSHHHILGVGIGDNSGWSERMTVQQVRALLDAGWVFYTVSPSTGKIALVRKFDCACGVKTIRSAPDAVTDNNLDNLPTCR